MPVYMCFHVRNDFHLVLFLPFLQLTAARQSVERLSEECSTYRQVVTSRTSAITVSMYTASFITCDSHPPDCTYTATVEAMHKKTGFKDGKTRIDKSAMATSGERRERLCCLKLTHTIYRVITLSVCQCSYRHLYVNCTNTKHLEPAVSQ